MRCSAPSVDIMSAAMRWLGGTEEEVVVWGWRIAALLGQWKDRDGTVYTLTRGIAVDQIDVFTVRPNGAFRYTEGLISLHGGVAHWGRSSSRRFSGCLDGSRMTWCRGGSKFHWSKMQ